MSGRGGIGGLHLLWVIVSGFFYVCGWGMVVVAMGRGVDGFGSVFGIVGLEVSMVGLVSGLVGDGFHALQRVAGLPFPVGRSGCG